VLTGNRLRRCDTRVPSAGQGCRLVVTPVHLIKNLIMSILINSNTEIVLNNRENIAAVEIQTDFLRQSKVRRTERFLKGPIPLRDICAAAKLPGKCLALFLAIHHQIALTGKPIVTLPASLLLELGITRSTKARCLSALEQAQLVAMLRSKGKAARIQLKKQ
jgi:hypothetical protein